MFGRIGVFDLILPAALISMIMWSLPPSRAGIVFYSMTAAALAF
jgi:hypothetical protein